MSYNQNEDGIISSTHVNFELSNLDRTLTPQQETSTEKLYEALKTKQLGVSYLNSCI